MSDHRSLEPDLGGLVTVFLDPSELIHTVKGWMTARMWLELLQRTNFRTCRTEIVEARNNYIALRRCDLSGSEVSHG